MLMNFKAFIKKILTNACVYFSAVTALYALIVLIIYVDDTEVLLDASRVLLFFVASLLVAIANGIFKIKKLHGAVKLFLHYLLTLFSFYACLMLPLSPPASTLTVGLAIFSVIYFIVAAIVALLRARYRSKSESDGTYRSQFGK